MPRPCKTRRVARAPAAREFKPCGVPRAALREVFLPLDGLEAMRLTDLDGLDQAEAARRMGVSRQTLGRILAAARRIVTQALAEGLALRIETDGAVVEEEAGRAAAGAVLLVAITTTGPDIDSLVEPRFGRAAGFLLADPTTGETGWLANRAAASAHGAGTAAVAALVRAGVRAVLAGEVGPKALAALTDAGIAVHPDLHGGTARDALARFEGAAIPTTPDRLAEVEPGTPSPLVKKDR
jgi:predicted DNA-binding protein (UPF0251 family)/predicted Fe-Mo cluster-binding NifX family protein